MGLAASQARFLGLTARKSNVEYQGQQINQQRTALANEILGLYTEYASLDVPVPPAVNDYQKTVYTIDSTYEKYEIENFTKIIDGDYKGYYDVTLVCNDSIPKAYTNSFRDCLMNVKNENEDIKFLSFQLGTDSYVYDETRPEENTITKITSDYDKYAGLKTIMESQGIEDGTFFMFVRNGINYYTSYDDIVNSDLSQALDSDGNKIEGQEAYYGSYAFDYQGELSTTKEVPAKAALTQDKSGRLSTIQILSCEDDPDLVNKAYSITTTSREDEAEYADAMNKYHYEKELYEREVEKINQKTEILQEEDRGLELQLRQLDTEQLALKTEMDTIESILKETMEKVFKTFDG